jgi:predicted helicase
VGQDAAVAATIYEILDGLRGTALSEADKGAKFERLMKAFLTTDPMYADQFKDVWLWNEWPGREGKHDTGIDLVAQDRLTEGYVAIQCKFYAPTSSIGKDDIDSFLSASGKEGFAERIIVSTTDKWNGHAEDAIKSQQIPVRRIGLSDLEASPIDWGQFTFETPEVLVTVGKKAARPHQVTAIEAAVTGFAEHDRGKLIMACGTGKTFTSLRLAEQMVGVGGSVLFLVPSISLLSQTLREWSSEAAIPLRPLAVCSDRKSTARSRNLDEDIATVDLALPATTNIALLTDRLQHAAAEADTMTVVFSTYQSIDVVARAQAQGAVAPFDLIICDEAHRTTGITLAEQDESAFVKVHNADYIKGSKRVYMTATPRIYDDASKAKAGEADAVLASMDNEAVYGPEFYRLGFGDAVARDLLTDYKVLVLAVDQSAVAKTFQMQLAEDGEMKLDDAAKIVGCWNGLAKKGHAEHGFDSDPEPMQRAVAFAGTIKASRKIEALFEGIVDQYVAVHADELGDEDGEGYLDCAVRHVDGTFNALERNTKLDWLRAEVPDGKCRILTNARCLSEGVDVPALDAVMFLSPRKSVVDVVQSVGRVMRKAPGKKYGYIILPVGIPADMTPEVALRDNKRYQVVWEVLQALRAHDDRFSAEVNKIDLTKKRSDRINVIGIGGGERGDSSPGQGAQQTLALNLAQLDEWREAVYAKIVAKVGSRRYWEDWASDVARIAEAHIIRITALLEGDETGVSAEFDKFLDGLRGNLNEGITRTDAIEMLAQHLITRPVFDALFGGYDFAAHNPVAQTMESMLTVLDEQSLDTENETLEKFYESVRMRVQGIDTADGRQRIIVELYESFFSTAFKRTVDKLGIVYTPVEIVDFIINSADQVLRAEFGQGLTDENVHILDGFTGTGTFLVRLIQSGLLRSADLPRKYERELHANEILLLAYYIAAVNIESAYQDAMTGHVGAQTYTPFPGLILTDTFQSWEEDDRLDFEMFRENNARLERLKTLPITVIVGNPPYSSGQDSANDDNANEAYPTLDEAIRATYAERSTARNKNSLYDSYIRAIRWATLRIKDRGVIAYVTNGGWLDSNTADGMRKSLAHEFSSIHVYNLRGNQRTAGEQSRKEGGKIFGGGSRATVAITVLVRNTAKVGPATIHYTDIGDYLSREEKLAKVAAASSIGALSPIAVTPNAHGDWLNLRSDDFAEFMPIGDKDGGPAIFNLFSAGLQSNRDAWVYNSSADDLARNMRRTINAYNAEVRRWRTEQMAGDDRTSQSWVDPNQTVISWSRSLRGQMRKGIQATWTPEHLASSGYRPFFRQHLYFDRMFNHERSQLPRMFPTPRHHNLGLYALNPGAEKPFAVLALDQVPDLALYGSNAGQFFARWSYEPVDDDEGALFLATSGDAVVDGYRRIDNITDHALATFRAAYGDAFTKDDIVAYVYGVLHSPDYRSRYAADLKRMLPRIPLVTDAAPFVAGGNALMQTHLNYESADVHPLQGLAAEPAPGVDAYEFYRVDKMRFGQMPAGRKASGAKADRTTVIYNQHITLHGIPNEAYRYQVGARSAIEWIIDRYQVKTDKASGIRNDPNNWSREVDDPRYILDLLARIVTVSLVTMEVVDNLPALELRSP